MGWRVRVSLREGEWLQNELQLVLDLAVSGHAGLAGVGPVDRPQQDHVLVRRRPALVNLNLQLVQGRQQVRVGHLSSP